jgi:hypothetical protein
VVVAIKTGLKVALKVALKGGLKERLKAGMKTALPAGKSAVFERWEGLAFQPAACNATAGSRVRSIRLSGVA